MLRLNVIRQHMVYSPMASSFQQQQQQQGHGESDHEELLFDPSVLDGLQWEKKKSSYKGNIDYKRPSPELILRPLSIRDYDRGFLQTLSQLTEVGPVTREEFEERFRSMQQCAGTYYVVVVEDTTRGRIVGSATLVKEQKFIHQTATRGRIEDVVVSEDCRGKQLGKLLVDVLILLAQKLGCYKLSLECKDNNVKFYEALGLKLDEQNFMTVRFKH